MKNPDEIITEEGFVLKFRMRESENITLSIPKDVLASLEKVAKKHVLPLYQHIAEIFGTAKSFMVLLRPDNYIGFISEDLSGESLRKYLGTILINR